MKVSFICLCIASALLIAVVVMRAVRSRRRRQEKVQEEKREMLEQLRAIDEAVPEGCYPIVKTLRISGMNDERCVFLVKNALSLVCRGTQVGISAEYGEAVVYLKEPVEDEQLREAVEKQGCRVLSITEANREKEPRHITGLTPLLDQTE